jgi:Bacterial conjugation TrbI-like protein
MSESNEQEQPPRELPGDEVAPKKKKILLSAKAIVFLAGCGVVFFSIVIYSNLSSHKNKPFGLPNAPAIKNVQGAAPVTPEYHQQLQQVDSQNYVQASKTGTDAFPYPEKNAPQTAGNDAPNLGGQTSDVGNQPPPQLDLQQSSSTPPLNVAGSNTGQSNGGAGGNGTVSVGAADQQKVTADATALDKIIQSQNQKPGSGGMTFVAANDLSAPAGNSLARGGLADPAGGSGSVDPAGSNVDGGVSAPSAGTLLPARMINGLNSDAPGPAIALITSGPLQGARIIGSFNTTRGGLVLKFTTMVIPVDGGKSTVTKAIQADAISETGDMVSANVNDHFLANAAVTFVAGFGQSMGNLLSQSGSAITTNGTSTITSYPALSLGQEAGAAAGGAVGAVGQQFQQIYGNRPPTITIAPGTTFTLAFIGSVSDSTGGVAGPSVTPSVGGLRTNQNYGGGFGVQQNYGGGLGVYYQQPASGQQ